MAFTTSEKVRQVLQAEKQVGEDADLNRYITTANSLLTYVIGKDTAGLLTSSLKIEIETYLAAHFYHLADPQVQSESYGGASATYQGTSGEGLKGSWWGQQAIALDVTGELLKLANGKRTASMTWLGKPPSQQTPIWNRD